MKKKDPTCTASHEFSNLASIPSRATYTRKRNAIRMVARFYVLTGKQLYKGIGCSILDMGFTIAALY